MYLLKFVNCFLKVLFLIINKVEFFRKFNKDFGNFINNDFFDI